LIPVFGNDDQNVEKITVLIEIEDDCSLKVKLITTGRPKRLSASSAQLPFLF
ncbi:hypothetical protein PanWU01x14_012520, partial [Parasponia andersonii]